jgi:hypothetical protein
MNGTCKAVRTLEFTVQCYQLAYLLVMYVCISASLFRLIAIFDACIVGLTVLGFGPNWPSSSLIDVYQ